MVLTIEPRWFKFKSNEPPWFYFGVAMVKDQVIDVKVRLKGELHKKLKEKSQQEERSMNYLINNAVELMVNQTKETKV